MKRALSCLCITMLAVLLATGFAVAQNNGAGAMKILEVEDANLATLRTLNTSRPSAVSLGASLEALQQDETSWAGLAAWVHDGGVVFLHTDAAQLFGYSTVEAREGTPQLAGQLYGHARNALPFGAHPLLWSDAAASSDLPPLAAAQRADIALGVQSVYYQLEAGDDLVVNHPAAVPLLRVTDWAARSNESLFAAAIAPFGKGWAVFTPRFVEQKRADGSSFTQNLMRLVRSIGPSPYAPALPANAQPAANTVTQAPLTGLSATLIETLSQGANGNDWATLLAAWKKANEFIPSAFLQPSQYEKPASTPSLLVAKNEADAVGAGLAAAARGEDVRGVRALLFVLRARLEYQRFRNDLAEQWLQAAEKIAPTSGEVLLWRGVLLAASAQNPLLNAQARAAVFGSAAQHWEAALAATPLVRGVTANAPQVLSGVPLNAIGLWQASAARSSQLMSVEPPQVSPVAGGGGLVVRHFDNDPTLRLALPGAALLNRVDTALGWKLDSEEILIFPSDEYYAAYSTAARTQNSGMAFNPLSRRANVVGNRILMVSQITLPVLLSPGPPPRYGQLGAGVPAVLSRLHTQVLIQALTQDGERAPSWLQLGLMSLANVVVMNDNTSTQEPGALANVARAGGLLTPAQFENVNLGSDQSSYAEVQARSIVRYLYAQFGAGAVVETLQRLGSGESIDEALQATTDMDEAQLFQAWRTAAFG